MTLGEIFSDDGESMDWLAHNCFSCEKLGDGICQYNPLCELEPILSYADMSKEIDENLVSMIIENGKLCRCKKFIAAVSTKQLNL